MEEVHSLGHVAVAAASSCWPAGGWTDGWTDGPTDRRTSISAAAGEAVRHESGSY